MLECGFSELCWLRAAPFWVFFVQKAAVLAIFALAHCACVRFPQEYYDAEDMLFFLYVRSVLQQELDVGFRSRWAELGSRSKDKSSPSALFLTQKECQQVSRVVFGSEQDPLCKRFLSVMDAHYIGPRSGKPDARKLEVRCCCHWSLRMLPWE